MDLEHIGSNIEPRYGVVVHYTNERILPTDEGLFNPTDPSYCLGLFDQLQNSSLDVGTPVAILHTSLDRQWLYVATEISDGWVAATNIACGTLDQIQLFSDEESLAVVIRPHADLFLNESKTEYYDTLRMGAHLPAVKILPTGIQVRLPIADTDGKLLVNTAVMNQEDIHTGYLPYTARSIYNQAFAMLNQPYGWGDSFGQQDCSRFIQMVFGTMGVHLTPSSSDQGATGTLLASFSTTSSDAERLACFSNFPAGNTLLHLPGHIMLYLGMVNGIPYAIHDTTRFPSMNGSEETINFLNRVVVSDLFLGEISNSLSPGTPTHASYLQRLSNANSIER